MRVLLVILFSTGCATAPPVAQPSGDTLGLRIGAPGECDPVEYTIPSSNARDAEMRVAISYAGFADSVVLTKSTGDSSADALAVDVVHQVFHCRHTLTREAPRVLDGYRVHFHPVEPAKPADVCFAALQQTEYPSLDVASSLRIALDEEGFILRVWHGSWRTSFLADWDGHRCHFTPARIDGKTVAIVFSVAAMQNGERPFDRVLPAPIYQR
jgi:hypothetical protein